MALMQCLVICIFLIISGGGAATSRIEPIIELPSGVGEDNWYCESWKLAVENNNAGAWDRETCDDFAKSYMTDYRYLSDSIAVASYARAYANSVKVTPRDAWIFDIDDTLLSLVSYCDQSLVKSVRHKDCKNSSSGDDDLDLPSLPASLQLYKTIQKLGFKIFLISERKQSQLNNTIENLCRVGYNNWDKLILRDTCDEDKSSLVFKSEKRIEVVEEGYIIQGNCGDQWSDLLGYATAVRSFKFPNLMYYTK
nr:acid phosphatase 1-like [Ipomoea batatas]GME17035.1 acid phosphatase 1-like [Ipomoea batatas]